MSENKFKKSKTFAQLTLKPGREKSLRKMHPWIFSGSIGRVGGNPEPGDTVEVCSSSGDFLAWASFNPFSKIRARVWSWEKKDKIDEEFFRQKIKEAMARREALGFTTYSSTINSFRLVNAESDSIPGFIADIYKDIMTIQCLTAGVEKWKKVLKDLLVEITGVIAVYERSEADERELEGLQKTTGILHGNDIPEKIEILENNLKFFVNLKTGHKTGFYFDQRDNRKILRDFSKDREVLDCFCYTGGFTVNALAGGAAGVISVDSSSKALEMARENVLLNNFPLEKCQWIEGDVFQVMRQFRDQNRKFDLVILDPPKFAQSSRHVKKAETGYKDINWLGFKLLRPGGILFTFSCSGAVSEENFQKIVAWAALDAGAGGKIVRRLTQATDHPVSLNFPESAYLKGFVIQLE